jgi:protein-S-isoprenylcysteine O-methyltransferase Ste14
MLGLAYSVVSYVAFLITFGYFALFSDGVLVPKSVDSGSAMSPGVAVAVDVGLMLLFGLQHSLMARAALKRRLTRMLPPSVERATYVLASVLVLLLLMWQWRPLPFELWNVESRALVIPLWTINALGWLGVPASSFMIDHFNLFGLKQALAGFRGQSLQEKGFVVPLFYRYVRHPMMTSLLVAFWVTPHMTLGHLLLSAGMTVYIVIGVHFEERALLRELGGAYELYRQTTPQFLPLGGKKTALRRSAAR